MQIHMCEPPGDILVFLTGEEEIEDACKKIAKECSQGGDSVRPSMCLCPHAPNPFSPFPPPAEQHLQSSGVGRWVLVSLRICA